MSSKRVQGTLFLVGGAALRLYYFDRDSTRDIGASLPSYPRILEVGREALDTDTFSNSLNQVSDRFDLYVSKEIELKAEYRMLA